MEPAAVILFCAFAMATAQYPLWGGMTGQTISSPLWRGQGTMMPWLSPSLSSMSMALPNTGIWRSHPIYRMAAAPSPTGMASTASAATTAATSVGSAAEKTPLLTVPQNIINVPKVPSSEEILTHMVLANANPKPYVDTISDFMYSSDAPKARAFVTPVYMAPVVRSTGNTMEDCTMQDMAQMPRWNREMAEWVY